MTGVTAETLPINNRKQRIFHYIFSVSELLNYFVFLFALDQQSKYQTHSLYNDIRRIKCLALLPSK